MTPQDLGRKWVPKSAAELLNAFNNGVLEETHWCDLKKEPSSNKETARDLASFSIDGGNIFIGLDEDLPDGSLLSPVDPAGLPEKLEQIAQQSVHPPLQITCTVVESGDDDGKGYVVVHIPASALAPHQVDGVYYGRGDKTKIRLAEPEVERLYQRRAQWTNDAGDMLREHVSAASLGAQSRFPQLFVVARPAGGWPEMCLDLISGKHLLGNFKLLTGNLQLDPGLKTLWTLVGRRSTYVSSILDELSAAGRTQAGAMVSSRMIPPSIEGTHPERITDLELSEDGELRFYRSAAGRMPIGNDNATPHFEIEYTVLAVREVIALARDISDKYGHATMWELGVAVEALRGTRPMLANGVLLDGPGYPGTDYAKTTRASVLELEKTPGAVAKRLVGGLYRVFNMEDRHLTAVFDDF